MSIDFRVHESSNSSKNQRGHFAWLAYGKKRAKSNETKTKTTLGRMATDSVLFGQGNHYTVTCSK
jgi:hypothetical protein